MLLAATLLLPGTAAADGRRLLEDFEQGRSAAWEEKVFKGRTDYQIVPDGAGHCLQAVSRGGASGLILATDYDLREFPRLTWRWRVNGIVAGGDERFRASDDYAARVYVIFPHWFFPRTRTLNYIWANRLPVGSMIPNAYTGNAMMIAVQSGAEKVGTWQVEERNVLEDYRRAFGAEPGRVGAIAVMTDTDNTGGEAVACYDDFWLLPPPEAGRGE